MEETLHTTFVKSCDGSADQPPHLKHALVNFKGDYDGSEEKSKEKSSEEKSSEEEVGK